MNIMQYKNLIYWVIKRYVSYLPAGVGYDDLHQEGLLAIIRAQKTFDPAKGSFQTHAIYWIRAYILRYIEKNSSVNTVCRSNLGKEEESYIDSFEDEDARRSFDCIDTKAHINSIIRKALVDANGNANDYGITLIRRRFVQGETLDMVGRALNVSRETVRLDEIKLLKVLRRA